MPAIFRPMFRLVSLSVLFAPQLSPLTLLRTRSHSHLPVRKMMYQCATCSHGGHQECFRRYYMEQPMVEISASLSLPAREVGGRGRSLSRSSTGVYSEESATTTTTSTATDPAKPDIVPGSTVQPRLLMGHRCAAGCGHFCWIANERIDDL